MKRKHKGAFSETKRCRGQGCLCYCDLSCMALRWCGHENIPTNMDHFLDLAWCEVEIERQREKKDVGIKEYTDSFNSVSTDP